MACFGALLLVMMTAAASAKPIPLGGITVLELEGVLKSQGLAVTQDKDEQGRVFLKTELSGKIFIVELLNCQKSRCGSVQFWTLFKGQGRWTLARVNQWNSTHRFAYAYLDDDKDVVLKSDFFVERGTTTDFVASQLELWQLALEEFARYQSAI